MALPVVRCRMANDILHRFADSAGPSRANPIVAFGRTILSLPGTGLRDGTAASKTYDLAFTGTRCAFATVTVNPDKWNSPDSGGLRFEARFKGSPPAALTFFSLKSSFTGGKNGWHHGDYDANPDLEVIRRELRWAYHSCAG